MKTHRIAVHNKMIPIQLISSGVNKITYLHMNSIITLRVKSLLINSKNSIRNLFPFIRDITHKNPLDIRNFTDQRPNKSTGKTLQFEEEKTVSVHYVRHACSH